MGQSCTMIGGVIGQWRKSPKAIRIRSGWGDICCMDHCPGVLIVLEKISIDTGGHPGVLCISPALYIIALIMVLRYCQSVRNVMSPWVVSAGDCQVTHVENVRAIHFDQLLSWSKAEVISACSERCSG